LVSTHLVDSEETRLDHAPDDLLNADTRHADGDERERPRVREGGEFGPERINLLLVALELALLRRVELVVALLLIGLELGVAAEEAEEDVVGERTEEEGWVRRGRVPGEEGKGEMSEGVAEVAMEE
jgi:hypothetical protein